MCNFRKLSLGVSMPFSFPLLLCSCSVDMIARIGIGRKGHRQLSKKIRRLSLCDALDNHKSPESPMARLSLEQEINFCLT